MLKIFVLKRRSLYIAVAALILIATLIVMLSLSGSDETFSETMKYSFKTISSEQAKVLLEKNPDLIVLDVRDEEEYLKGHLPNATQLTYKDLKKKLDYYSQDHIYMIYSSANRKSKKVADLMATNGFSRIYLLDGGIEKWPYDLAE